MPFEALQQQTTAPMTCKTLRFYLSILLPVLLFTHFSIAQSSPGSLVRSAETGQPIVGATITLSRTGNAVVSDSKGQFFITASPDDSIKITAIGFLPLTVRYADAATITMATDPKTMNEVVVTALGIKREERSLGYATTTVRENAVKDARTTNWVNALSGKVAGLNIQGTGSGPIGSSRITLRGENSLNLDNNQALIIVDGVPISNRITGTGFRAHLSQDSPVDFGSGVSDINPDDIETVSVLKGPGATALYGSRAANGAIIITTKSGARKDKGIGVTVNSTISYESVNRWPDYQFEYGEGRTSAYYSYGNSVDGVNTSTNVAAGRAWGPRFNGQSYFQYNPASPTGLPAERRPWVAYDDYISGFFRTGRTITNSVALEGGSDKSSARASFTHLKNEWILPNTGFERYNAAFSFNQKLSDKLKINGRLNYTNKQSDNLPAAGYNNQTIMYFLILGTTPNVKPEWFKPYWRPGFEGVQQRSPFNPGPDNPYLILYEMLNKVNRHGAIGNLSATYSFNDHLDLMMRTGVDMGWEYRSQQRPFSMTKYQRGMYREQSVFNYEVNSDFLLSYRNKIKDNWKYSVNGGGNIMKQRYDFRGMYADQLAQPGIYQLSNSLDPVIVDPTRTEKAIYSLYGTGQLSFEDKIFLDVTGRNDWSSTLPFSNNSYFYPSVSTSFVLSDLLRLPRQISFAKLRLSWAQVGNDTRAYQTDKYYDRIFGNSFTNPTILFNASLRPEISSSYEAGLDLRLFRSRLNLDIALYTTNSRNQIIALPVDPVSGYSSALINAGLINSRGMEVQLTGKPISKKDFTWTSTITWSLNRSYVRELTQGVPTQVLFAHDNNVTVEARIGGRVGDLWGRGFQRSPDGKIVYNSQGLPAPLDPVAQRRGNAFADWRAGWLNEFTFKGFRFSFLFDGQMGGVMYSQTNHKNNTLGKTRVTLPGRDEGIVGDGVVWNSTSGKYEPNTVRVTASSYYDNYYQIGNSETNTFDASFIKLREARVEFTLPARWAKKAGMRQVSIALFGRELFNWTKFPGFDPEGGNLNSGTLTPGVELTQFPTARSIGANLTLKF